MENQEAEVKEILLTLEELYNGKEVNYPTQVETSCFKCGGKGKIAQSFSFAREAACNLCDGKGKKIINTNLKVRIPAGSDTGFEKTLRSVGWPPHDVVLKIKQKMHPFLNRRGIDLYLCMQLTMAEALCGFQKIFTTLDGRELIISSPKGSVIAPNSIRCIENEGFPMLDKPRLRGKLFVKFLVTFPDLSPDTAKLVAQTIKDENIVSPESDASDADEVDLHDL